MNEVIYISAACNQTPTSAHWGTNNLICYASCNAVLIYDSTKGSGGKVVKTLCGHTSRVNSVQWILGKNNESEVISGSSDGTVIVWTLDNELRYTSEVLKGHLNGVNIVEGMYGGNETTIIVSASVDSTIRVWLRKDVSFIQSQVIQLKKSVALALSLKLCYLPNQQLLMLAAGLDDSRIHLYVQNEENTLITFDRCQILEGHENWVRGLDFKHFDDDLYLISGAQDSLLRLWKISTDSKQQELDIKSNINHIDQFNFIMKRKEINTLKQKYIISLECVLRGHEGWVYSVSWHPSNMSFLSASIDKSIILWTFDKESSMWLESVRVGEMGGNTLGFFGAIFGPSGSNFVAHGYNGAFHIWNYSKERDYWEPAVTVGGHLKEVSDIEWEPSGAFLVSTSFDQTTRIHASWSTNGLPATWHEIARPQIHGYDIASLAILSRYSFASGADEKVIRIFKAPANFVDNFRRLCNISNDPEGDEILQEGEKPQGAAVPSLGLSNKAVYEENNEEVTKTSQKDSYSVESQFRAVTLNEPPTEETLIQNTLWPEIQKLYGHGYELFSLASSPDGKYLASASKANNQEHAAIIIWDQKPWTQIQKLISHSLTVVQIEFSPDSRHILSVSRDRRWSLFSRNDSSNKFELKASTDKKTGVHSRIIWCCCWTHDSQFFSTGSRDGKVVVWGRNEGKMEDSCLGKYENVCVKEFKGESVTAVAFNRVMAKGFYVLAVGFEKGVLSLNLWKPGGQMKEFSFLDNSQAHHLSVKRLRFRPVKENKEIVQLASCGCDHAVKIYNILLPIKN